MRLKAVLRVPRAIIQARVLRVILRVAQQALAVVTAALPAQVLALARRPLLIAVLKCIAFNRVARAALQWDLVI